ncbi:hypothetical protein ACRRTK_013526 [Alexandromys fortis]
MACLLHAPLLLLTTLTGALKLSLSRVLIHSLLSSLEHSSLLEHGRQESQAMLTPRKRTIINPVVCVKRIHGLVENHDLMGGNFSNEDDMSPEEMIKAWTKHENKT